jgi:hypothetical protein
VSGHVKATFGVDIIKIREGPKEDLKAELRRFQTSRMRMELTKSLAKHLLKS